MAAQSALCLCLCVGAFLQGFCVCVGVGVSGGVRPPCPPPPPPPLVYLVLDGGSCWWLSHPAALPHREPTVVVSPVGETALCFAL